MARVGESWLKSVSAFANGTGGTLFFGVKSPNDIPGIVEPQVASDRISELVNERISPKPIYSLRPIREGNAVVLALFVPPGRSTPYYYRADGVCVAYIRSGDAFVKAREFIKLAAKKRVMVRYRDWKKGKTPDRR